MHGSVNRYDRLFIETVGHSVVRTSSTGIGHEIWPENNSPYSEKFSRPLNFTN